MSENDLSIFNTTKTVEEYSEKKLFGVGHMPLIDTIHRNYPKIWDLYQEMESLNWNANEIDYSQCLIDFEKAPLETSEMMIKTIMWQWENDSIAAQAPPVIIAPFEPCTEVWEGEVSITNNEGVHGNTYSEIIRMSFKDPEKVLSHLLDQKEKYERSGAFGKNLKEVKRFSTKLAYDKEFGNELPSEEEIVKHLILYYFTMLCLERIQFMASFSITFTICQSGYFLPIGSAVMKICQDELEVHSEFRKEILKNILATEIGKRVFEDLRPRLTQTLEDVVDQEQYWTRNYIFENDTKYLVGTNADIVCNFVLFNAKDVANTYKLKTKFNFPKNNPMPHLESWMNLSKVQQAPQEQDLVSYTSNSIERVNEQAIYDFN